MLGNAPREIVGLTFGDVAHRGDAGPSEEDRRRLLAGELPWLRFRRCYKRRDGSPLWAQLTAAVARDETGRPLYYVDVVEDIAGLVAVEEERNRLLAREAAARAEAEELTALMSATAEADSVERTIDAALAAIPRLMTTVSCNIALPDASGVLRFKSEPTTPVDHLYSFRPRQGLVGRAFASGKLVESDDVAADRRSHRRDLDARAGIHGYMAMPLIARGRTLGVIAVGRPDVGGFQPHEKELLARIAHCVAVALEAEQSRQALRAQVAQKTAILEQMSDAVMVTDREGRIVLANARMGEVLGEDVATLIGRTPDQYTWKVAEVATAPSGWLEERPILRTMAGATGPAEVRVTLRSGEQRWYEGATALLRDERGEIVGAVAVGRDVTERHEAAAESEQARARAAQTEKLRAVGQMASGVAHNLNQSLTLVAAYSELAREAVAGPNVDAVDLRAKLDVIAQAAIDGGETVKRLLTFVRGRAVDTVPRAVDVGALLREVAELTAPRWRELAQAEGRPVQLRLEAGRGLTLVGREPDLREALTNLVFNAVDAMPEGGQLGLTARAVPGGVEVEVSDSGTGMSEEVRSRLFEPFFSTKGERGTGLGLAMVYSIVELHGGTIDVRSAPGQGSTFTLRLPSVVAPPAAPAGPSARPGTEVRRVLVVDDEEALRTAIGLALRREGHHVLLVGSAEAAIAQLEREPFDVVISDLAMGQGMNGWGLVEWVRRERPATRFVLCSGLGTSIDPEEARTRGVDLLLSKPYRVTDLRQAVQTPAGDSSP